MSKFVYNFVSSLPGNIAVTLLTGIIIGIVFLFKKILIPKYMESQENRRKKENADKELLKSLTAIVIDILHEQMGDLYNTCYRQGFKSLYDNMQFHSLASDYHHLGGNTDGDSIIEAFDKLALKAISSVPEKLGVNNPAKKSVNNTDKNRRA